MGIFGKDEMNTVNEVGIMSPTVPEREGEFVINVKDKLFVLSGYA
jgi:hypothetical protein